MEKTESLHNWRTNASWADHAAPRGIWPKISPLIDWDVAGSSRLYVSLLAICLAIQIGLFVVDRLQTFWVTLVLLAEAGGLIWIGLKSVNSRASYHFRRTMTPLALVWLAGASIYWGGFIYEDVGSLRPLLDLLVLGSAAALRLMITIPMVIWPISGNLQEPEDI